MTDERERFKHSIHLMRDAFLVLKDQVERAGWSAAEQNDQFFDGYEQTKRVFGDVLLQRDIETIFHPGSEGVDPEG